MSELSTGDAGFDAEAAFRDGMLLSEVMLREEGLNRCLAVCLICGADIPCDRTVCEEGCEP